MITWLFDNPEIGWVAVVLYLMWEIRGPKGKIKELTDSIHHITVVVRGLARANENVDTEKVDDLLVDNGTEPGDVIEGRSDKEKKETETIVKD